jgi:hypothetical protein
MNLLKRSAHGVRVGGVSLHDKAPDVIRNRAQRFSTAAHDCHVGAIGHQAARDSGANAGSAAGDESGFSREPHFCNSIPRLRACEGSAPEFVRDGGASCTNVIGGRSPLWISPQRFQR